MIQPGVILAAHPKQKQGFFSQSVILITEHHKFSTVGLCINKPQTVTVGEATEIDWPWDDVLCCGGPVNSAALFMLHTSEWYSTNTMSITDSISISSDLLMIEKAAMGNTPQHWRFFNGMCGWSPGQLHREIVKNNMWLTCDSNEHILFNTEIEDIWEQAIELCAQKLTNQYF